MRGAASTRSAVPTLGRIVRVFDGSTLTVVNLPESATPDNATTITTGNPCRLASGKTCRSCKLGDRARTRSDAPSPSVSVSPNDAGAAVAQGGRHEHRTTATGDCLLDGC